MCERRRKGRGHRSCRREISACFGIMPWRMLAGFLDLLMHTELCQLSNELRINYLGTTALGLFSSHNLGLLLKARRHLPHLLFNIRSPFSSHWCTCNWGKWQTIEDTCLSLLSIYTCEREELNPNQHDCQQPANPHIDHTTSQRNRP